MISALPPTISERDLPALERFSFGDGAALADELLALVLAGDKRATCWAVREGELTHVGKKMIVCDGAGRPRAIIETVALMRRRFCDVDDAFATAEGEGDGSLAWWRAVHQAYFERTGGFSCDMELWCEHFSLVAIVEAAS